MSFYVDKSSLVKRLLRDGKLVDTGLRVSAGEIDISWIDQTIYMYLLGLYFQQDALYAPVLRRPDAPQSTEGTVQCPYTWADGDPPIQQFSSYSGLGSYLLNEVGYLYADYVIIFKGDKSINTLAQALIYIRDNLQSVKHPRNNDVQQTWIQYGHTLRQVSSTAYRYVHSTGRAYPSDIPFSNSKVIINGQSMNIHVQKKTENYSPPPGWDGKSEYLVRTQTYTASSQTFQLFPFDYIQSDLTLYVGSKDNCANIIRSRMNPIQTGVKAILSTGASSRYAKAASSLNLD